MRMCVLGNPIGLVYNKYVHVLIVRSMRSREKIAIVMDSYLELIKNCEQRYNKRDARARMISVCNGWANGIAICLGCERLSEVDGCGRSSHKGRSDQPHATHARRHARTRAQTATQRWHGVVSALRFRSADAPVVHAITHIIDHKTDAAVAVAAAAAAAGQQ